MAGKAFGTTNIKWSDFDLFPGVNGTNISLNDVATNHTYPAKTPAASSYYNKTFNWISVYTSTGGNVDVTSTAGYTQSNISTTQVQLPAIETTNGPITLSADDADAYPYSFLWWRQIGPTGNIESYDSDYTLSGGSGTLVRIYAVFN